MKYKLLAFDIDGTLTNSKKEITPRTREAILKAAEAGCIIVIASGRPRPGVVRYSEELKLSQNGGYICALNGGLIERYGDGFVLERSLLSPEYYDEIIELAKHHRVNIMTYEKDTVISEKTDDKYLQLEARINGLDTKEVDNLKDYLTFSVPKFLMLGDGDYLGEVEKDVYKKLHDRMDITRSEPFFLEILPKDINKATALDKLRVHFGLEVQEIMAFGDGYNDISMIEYAGMGVAMANANDSLKAVANHICKSNDEDGIADVINEFVLD